MRLESTIRRLCVCDGVGSRKEKEKENPGARDINSDSSPLLLPVLLPVVIQRVGASILGRF